MWPPWAGGNADQGPPPTQGGHAGPPLQKSAISGSKWTTRTTASTESPSPGRWEGDGRGDRGEVPGGGNGRERGTGLTFRFILVPFPSSEETFHFKRIRKKDMSRPSVLV